MNREELYKSYNDLLNKCGILWKNGQWLKTRLMTQEIIKSLPVDRAWIYLGESLEKTGYPLYGLRSYEKGLEVVGNNTNNCIYFIRNIVNLSYKLEFFDTSRFFAEYLIQYYKNQLENAQENTLINLYNAISWNLIHTKDYNEATEYINKCLSISKPNPFFLHTKAFLLKETNKMDEALTLYEEAVKLEDKYALFHYDLGKIYEILNKKNKAIKSYENALNLETTWREPWESLKKLKPKSKVLSHASFPTKDKNYIYLYIDVDFKKTVDENSLCKDYNDKKDPKIFAYIPENTFREYLYGLIPDLKNKVIEIKNTNKSVTLDREEAKNLIKGFDKAKGLQKQLIVDLSELKQMAPGNHSVSALNDLMKSVENIGNTMKMAEDYIELQSDPDNPDNINEEKYKSLLQLAERCENDGELNLAKETYKKALEMANKLGLTGEKQKLILKIMKLR